MGSKIYLTDEDIHKHSKKLIKKLKRLNLDPENTAIVAITRGGLVPSQYISYALGIRNIFVVNSSLYEGEEKSGNQQEISNVFLIDFESYDNFIIVDDIYDSGETMEGVLFALEQVSETFNENCLFIPAVLYSQKSKKYLNSNGIIYGKRFKGSPWVVFTWDKYSEEF
jgi:xanthine phosphoribosyltransferase